MASPDKYIQDLEGGNLGPYEIRSKLGEGGMGAVYLARDPALDRDVAVKVLPPEFARDRSYIQRFEREARALARLRHPNLVHIYSVGRDNGIHYFAMELIEGEALSDYMRRRGRLDVQEALRITTQILSALHSLHRLGVTHRDIKAANIMIDRSGRAVLMDFGLMKDRDQEGLTSVGAVLGTPEYMAPEQADGMEATPLSDIYSFGILIYEMLAGRLPFLGTSVIAVLKAHMEEAPPGLSGIRPDLPKSLVKIVHKMLAKKPEARYLSLAYLARDLLDIHDDQVLREAAGEAAGAPTLILRKPAADRRLEKAVLVLGAIALVAALVVLFSMLRGNGVDSPYGETGDIDTPQAEPGVNDVTGPDVPPPDESLVEIRLENGRVLPGRMVEMKYTPEGPVWVLETGEGETVVGIEPGVEIVYPGR